VTEERREGSYHERVREAGPRYRGFDLPSTEVVLNLLYTYDVFHQLSARYMAKYGLSKSTLNVLMLLRHGPREGMRLHDLGDLLLVSKANMTGLIDHLERQGLVKRVTDTRDRRARLARVTKEGETLLERFVPVHYRNLNRLLEGLADEEKQILIKLLKKMRTSLLSNSGKAA
jgi:DNA-binding MarR family transcriptional regulator